MYQFLMYPMMVVEHPDDREHRFTLTSPDFSDLCIQGETIADAAHRSGAEITARLSAGLPAPTPTECSGSGQRVIYIAVDQRQ